jgi:hypothetical protein
MTDKERGETAEGLQCSYRRQLNSLGRNTMRRVLLAAAALSLAFAAHGWAQSGPTTAPASPPASPTVGSAAGASTVPLPPPARSLPVAATLPRQQYVVDTGAAMREWHPVVDSYLDSSVPPGREANQVEVKNAWQKLRAEWDSLQKADDATWSTARTGFEAAWNQFQAAWEKAKRTS